MNIIDPSVVANAKRIAIPKGENSKDYRDAFEQFCNIEIPSPKPRALKSSSNGQEFYWLRAMDIPKVVAERRVDVGVCGSDAIMEYGVPKDIRFLKIGGEVCRFSLLATSEGNEWLDRLLSVDRRYNVPVDVPIVTSLPRMFDTIARESDLPFRTSTIQIGGSVEIYPDLFGLPVVADIIREGKTASAQGLIENLKLAAIMPEIVVAKQ